MIIHSFLSSSIYLIIISCFTFGQSQCLQRSGKINSGSTTPNPISRKFKLITTLYNEKNEKRCLEYIACMEENLKHPSIDSIHVIYDIAKDDACGSTLLNYLKSKKIEISYVSERTSYENLFEVANKNYPFCKIIISNADIYFNESLISLEPYDLYNKFLALTRWDVCPDGKLVEFSPGGASQDTWIFQTPLPIFENSSIKVGILGCEHAIAYQAQKSGLIVLNPSLSIKCCHLHLSEVRNYTQYDTPYKNMGRLCPIHKCTVMEIDENQKAIYLNHLRLKTGRRTPIILADI